jgi:hypothetical protein
MSRIDKLPPLYTQKQISYHIFKPIIVIALRDTCFSLSPPRDKTCRRAQVVSLRSSRSGRVARDLRQGERRLFAAFVDSCFVS